MVLGEKPERLLSILTDQIELLTGARPGLETIIAAGKVGGQSLVVKWINLTLFIFSFTLRSFQAFCIHGTVAHSFRYVFWTVTYYASLSISCKGRLYTQNPNSEGNRANDCCAERLSDIKQLDHSFHLMLSCGA